MHIIALIIGALVTGFIWYQRLKIAREAASQAVDLAQTAANLPRKMKFKRGTKVDPIAQIETAKEAAAAMMCVVVGEQGEADGDARPVIETVLMTHLDVDLAEAQELTAFGHWIAQSIGTDAKQLRRVAARTAELAPDAGADLLDMIGKVAPSADVDHLKRVVKQVTSAYA